MPPLRLCASARVLPIRSCSAFSYAPIGLSNSLQLVDQPAHSPYARFSATTWSSWSLVMGLSNT